MSKLRFDVFVLLLCGIFEMELAAELDEQVKYLASLGGFSPKYLVLEKEKPISLPWEGNSDFKPTIISLQLNGCKGTIDKSTFAKLPNLKDVNFSGCQDVHIYPGAFSALPNLEKVGFLNSTVKFEKEAGTVDNAPLPRFKMLMFHLSAVSGLNRNAMHEFSLLNTFKIDNTEANDISSDAFVDLKKVTKFVMRTSKIPNFDISGILKLDTISYLALHDLDTNTKIDYDMFKSLPNLNTILFDTLSYENLNFDAFPRLHTVEIGLGDTKESQQFYNNDLYHKIMVRVKALKSKDISNKIVSAGKDDITLGNF